MKVEEQEYDERLNFIIYLMNKELDDMDYQIDIGYFQANEMYWLNPQEHLVLHLMSLIKLENRRGSKYYGSNRQLNAFIWLNSFLEDEKLDVGSEDFKVNLRNILNGSKDKKGAFEKLCDGKMKLTSDKTKELLFYILHYMSVQQNLIDKKERESVVRILSVFIDEYGNSFNVIDNEEELKHLNWFYNKIKPTVYKYDCDKLKESLENFENIVFHL